MALETFWCALFFPRFLWALPQYCTQDASLSFPHNTNVFFICRRVLHSDKLIRWRSLGHGIIGPWVKGVVGWHVFSSPDSPYTHETHGQQPLNPDLNPALILHITRQYSYITSTAVTWPLAAVISMCLEVSLSRGVAWKRRSNMWMSCHFIWWEICSITV